MLMALFRVLRTGTQWKSLPADFGPWQTVRYYFRKWPRGGSSNCPRCWSARPDGGSAGGGSPAWASSTRAA